MHIHWRCASWWWFGNPFRDSFKSSVRKSGQWGHVWVRTCSCLRTVFCLFYGTNIYFVSISVSISCPSKHWIQSKSSDRIFSCLHDELDFIHAIFLFFCIPFVQLTQTMSSFSFRPHKFLYSFHLIFRSRKECCCIT